MSRKQVLHEMLGDELGEAGLPKGMSYGMSFPAAGGMGRSAEFAVAELPQAVKGLQTAVKKGDEKKILGWTWAITHAMGILAKNIGLEAESVPLRKAAAAIKKKVPKGSGVPFAG